MIRAAFITLAIGVLAPLAVSAAHAEDASNRLLIVNGDSGRVIYDDHRNDLFCVTRTYVRGWNSYGRRVYGRNMRCR